jgi:streptogramin lyase
MIACLRVRFTQVPLIAGFVAVMSLAGASKVQCQTTAIPTINASTVGGITTLTISDITPNATIYYAVGGRTVTTHSILYAGPLTVALPITLQAIAVAPGYSVSSSANATYTTILGTTTLATSLNPSIEGQTVTYTATVTPASGISLPAGALQFSVNGEPLGQPMQLNTSGVATYSTSQFPPADLAITASYIPSSGAPFTSSTSASVVQEVYSSLRETDNVFFNNSVKPLGSGFNKPYGVAVDANENVFVADASNSAVYEIVAASNYAQVITLGGGFEFSTPTGVALDSNGNLYVPDAGKNGVFELSAANGYSTAQSVGTGFYEPFGVAVDAQNNLYIADTGNHAVKMIAGPSPSNAGESVTLASGFQSPWGVAVDATGNVFVTDVGNRTVNLLAAGNRSIVTPLAPSGFFYMPYGIAVDAHDNLFISDVGYGAIREISLSDDWTSICGDGYGFYVPVGVAVDKAGNMFIADTDNGQVKKISEVNGDFGSVQLSKSSPNPISMTFFFDEPYTIGSTAIVGQDGAASADFTDAGTGTCWANTPYAGITTCTIDVVFTPHQSGPSSASVELLDTSGNPLASGMVQGIGASAN